MEGKYESIAIEVLRPYTRDAPYPLDATTLFTSYASAMAYAKHDASAYPGQVVAVDDSLLEKTAIYQISYDKNGSGLTLSDVVVGSGSQAFRFAGSVATKADLPASYVLNGDMYYVKDEQAMYVAVKGADDSSPVWQKLGMDITIPFVTRENDGILTKEQYSTFFNSKSGDAVYFNSPLDDSESVPKPETNRWIGISHSDAETAKDYSIPSVGKVKQILSESASNVLPYISVSSDVDADCEAGKTIYPTISVSYHKGIGGETSAARIYRNGTLIYEALTGGASSVSYKDAEGTSAEAYGTSEYEVEVDYAISSEGAIPAGTCRETIMFSFYDIVYYGTNLDTFPSGSDASGATCGKGYMKKNATFAINIVPPADLGDDATDDEWAAGAITSLKIDTPIGSDLDYILYVPMQDYSAASLFTVETSPTQGRKLYVYRLPGTRVRFRSRVSYVFRFR